MLKFLAALCLCATAVLAQAQPLHDAVYRPAHDHPKLQKAWIHGNHVAGGNFPGTYYSSNFSNSAALASTSVFPIGVYLQNPSNTGHSGSNANVGVAAKNAHINILFGIDAGSGSLWPLTFGGDGGQLANAKTNGLYVISGGDPSSNSTAMSVASVLSLCATDSACANVIGYDWADEPACGSGLGQRGNVPTEVAAVNGYDSTRLTMYNEANWVAWFGSFPGFSSCAAQSSTALAAPGVPSFDNYPMINPYGSLNTNYCPGGSHVQSSDFATVPYDCLWLVGQGTQNMINVVGQTTKPTWVFIDSGSDALGESGENNVFTASVTNGSPNLVIGGSIPQFGAGWIGLKVSGTDIPASTTISSITSGSTAVMSANATGTASVSVTVSGGVSQAQGVAGCVVAINLCMPNGNEYRATASQVNSEAWNAIISGALGILWFCDDSTSLSFCMGDSASGGAAATAAYNNLTYVDNLIESYAPQLNAVTSGQCSMQVPSNQTTTTSCTNGILTYATGTTSCPGLAIAKTYGGATWLFAMSDRASNSVAGAGCYSSGSGATFTATLTGLAGKTATVKYDSNSQYDPTNDTTNATHLLNGSAQFTDTLGDHGDGYRVKIYSVQ